MATRIKALGTYRNNAKLPDGIVRRGQTVVVSDSYAEELVDGGKAEVVEEDVTVSQQVDVSKKDDQEGSASDGAPGEPEPSEGAGAKPWPEQPIPKDCPKYDKLKEEEIYTLGDLDHFVSNDLLGDIKGIGPAYEDKIAQFLQDAIPQEV